MKAVDPRPTAVGKAGWRDALARCPQRTAGQDDYDADCDVGMTAGEPRSPSRKGAGPPDAVAYGGPSLV